MATSTAELAHGEKLQTQPLTQSLTQLIWCPRNQSFCFGIRNSSCYSLLQISLLPQSIIIISTSTFQLSFALHISRRSRTSVPQILQTIWTVFHTKANGLTLQTLAVLWISYAQLVFYSAPVREQCIVISFVCLCVCAFVCLSVYEHISGTTRPIFTKFVVQIPCGHGSVLVWHCCDILCTSGLRMTSCLAVVGRMAMRG